MSAEPPGGAEIENGRNANHQSNYGTSLVSGIHGGFFIAILAVQHNSVVLVKIQWVWLRFKSMVEMSPVMSKYMTTWICFFKIQSRTAFCSLKLLYSGAPTEIQYIWISHVPVSFRYFFWQREIWDCNFLHLTFSWGFFRPLSVCMHHKSSYNVLGTVHPSISPNEIGFGGVKVHSVVYVLIWSDLCWGIE